MFMVSERRKEQMHQYYYTHRELALQYARDHYDPEKKRKDNQRYYFENSEKLKRDVAEYRVEHREERNARERKRYALHPETRYYTTHPEVRIMSSAVSGRLNGLGVRKSDKTAQYVGCTPQFFRLHLEALFKPGMVWANHGDVWEVDHRVPLAWFNLKECPENMFIASHWTNLQPMFKKDNRKKAARYVI